MTKTRQKELERIHILRTLINYGPMAGVRLVGGGWLSLRSLLLLSGGSREP